MNIKLLTYSMNIKLLTKEHLEFLGLKGGYTAWSESTVVKMPHCWKSYVTAQLSYQTIRAAALKLVELIMDDEKIT